MTARREDWDERIRAIIDPIESRMYAIQINHAEWLRENHQHLVMTGPGHDTYKAIQELLLQACREAYEAGFDCADFGIQGGHSDWLGSGESREQYVEKMFNDYLKSRATQGEDVNDG